MVDRSSFDRIIESGGYVSVRTGSAVDANSIPIEKKDAYTNFIDKHLVGEFDGDFAVLPIGFGCFPIPIEGNDHFYTWQAAIGDLSAFKEAKNKELGNDVMPTANIIEI